MPLIERIETDMFVLSHASDYMVNPCNLVGVSGAGLSLEFKKRIPEFIPFYQEACRTKDLRIGTLQILEDTGLDYGLIMFPTKRHFYDDTLPEDLLRGLEALRRLCSEERYRYATICIPMLGCGCGKQDYEIVYPMMKDHLSDLDTTIFLSMHPEKTEFRPTFLGIIGPDGFGKTPDDKAEMTKAIAKAADHWKKPLTDYHGIVTLGETSADIWLGGAAFKTDDWTYVKTVTNKDALVIKPNILRNGVGSATKAVDALVSVCDDLIIFKPTGRYGHREVYAQLAAQEEKERRRELGIPLNRIGIAGDKSTELKDVGPIMHG